MKRTLALAALVLMVTVTHAQVPEGVIKICFPKQHHDVLNYLVRVANDRGFFDAEKLKVKIEILEYNFEEFYGPLGTFQAEMWEYSKGGKARICHMGTLSVAGVMALPPKRRDQFVPLMLSKLDSSNDMDLVVGAKSKIKSIEGLKGKLIDVGSLPAFLTLSKVLASRGLKLSDVQIRPSNSEKRMLNGLNVARYDAAFSIPMLSGMLESRGSVRVLEANVVSKHLKTVPSLFLMVNKGFMYSWPHGIQKFMRALDKARAYVDEHPEALTMAAESLNNQMHAKRLRMTDVESNQAARRMGRNSILDMRKNSDAVAIRAGVKNYYQQLTDLFGAKGDYPLETWLKQSVIH